MLNNTYEFLVLVFYFDNQLLFVYISQLFILIIIMLFVRHESLAKIAR